MATEGHHHSLAVALASIILGFWGLIFTLFGLAALLGGPALLDAALRQGGLSSSDVGQARSVIGVVGIVLLVIGVPQLLSAIWAPLHSGWARVLGIIVGILGVLLGLLVLATPATTVNGTRSSPLVGALFFLVPYGFALLALLLSRKHFRR
ncbi:MAG: hypothetical protein H0W07_00060 [Chloroflexi bacterium]|nr:hypothetical protein [Chloroflexota bacterium]